MSRLQKKKTTLEKKRKRSVSADSPSSGVVGASTVKSTVTTPPPKAKIDKGSVASVAGEPNFIQSAMEFFRGVKVELKKVTWPSRKQTTGTTLVVIIFVFVVAAFLGLFDYSLSKLVQVVLT